MATIRVHTTQNVSLEYEVASIGDRMGATIIDYLVLIAWGGLWALLITNLADGGSSVEKTDWGSASGIIAIVLIAIIVAPYIFYHLVCEVFFNGQSIGKKAVNIRVIRLDGTAPRLGDYLLRWLLRIVDINLLSGMVAILTIAATGKGQRLGDLAAGTSVIKVRPVAPQALPSAADLVAPADYQMTFPQAALLADHDVALIRQLLQRVAAHNDHAMLGEVAHKIKEITGIQTDLPDGPFVQTVLRDHGHLASQ